MGTIGSCTSLSSVNENQMCGLIPISLQQNLFDQKNYQNQTNGVEQLKTVLSEMDLKTVSCESVVDFIDFLYKLMDDNNISIFSGILQVLNLLVQKLDSDVDKYYKQIVHVALKPLGDMYPVLRREHMNVFQQVMRIVGPEKVLILIIGHLKHKNARVREDVLNIITAAMLVHPRKGFIIHLCFVVAPYLADSQKRVRHAAMELFAVFDYCLDTGKKQPIMKAIDRVELTGEAEGLTAAVNARIARRILPWLAADGMVKYALVIPKPGQQHMPQFSSGPDLDWIINGPRAKSARCQRTDMDPEEGCSASSSLGSLTDEMPVQRSTVSAPPAGSQKPCSALNRKLSNKSNLDDFTTTMMLNQGTCITHFEPFQSSSSGQRREPTVRLHQRGSLDSNLDIFKAASSTDAERGFPRMSKLLGARNSVERTSFQANPSPPGSFLLPPIPPCCSLTWVQLTPTLSCRHHADPKASLSSKRANNREMSPRRSGPSTWRNNNDEIMPVTPKKHPNEQVEWQPFCRPEVALTQSLRMLMSKDWAKKTDGLMSLSFLARYHSDVLSNKLHDVCLNLIQEVQSQRSEASCSAMETIGELYSGLQKGMDQKMEATSKVLLHEAGESNSFINHAVQDGMVQNYTATHRLGAGNPTAKTDNVREPLGKKKTPSSIEASPRGVQQQEKVLSDASVDIGQRVSYSDGVAVEEKPKAASPPIRIRPAGREPLRALRPAKVIHNTEACNMSEGVVGRGVFGSMVLPSHHEVPACPEQYESINKALWEPPGEAYGHAVSGSHIDSENNAELDEAMPETVTRESPPISPAPIRPFHQPRPPTGRPTGQTLTRQRRLRNQTRAKPALSKSSDATMPAKPKKNFKKDMELQPVSSPELALTQCFTLLNSDDWQKKIEGLMIVRSLAVYHSDLLTSSLQDICFAVVQEVQNMRSGVSRIAVVTLGELFSSLQTEMDKRLDTTAKTLLQKASECSAFIRQDVDAALDSMVQNCTPTRSMNALLTGGLGHLNVVVRKCTAQHLATLVEKIGAEYLLSGSNDLTARILPAVSKLAHDSSQEVRKSGRKMLLFLSSHCDFDKMVEKHIPLKDLPTLKKTVIKLRAKGLDEMPQDTPSVQGKCFKYGSGMVQASVLNCEPQHPSSPSRLTQKITKAQFPNMAEKSDYILQIEALMSSKDFRERIKAIDQVVADCEENPNMVIGTKFRVFDAFKERLQESNSKVNLYALEALQKIITLLKDNMAQVINIIVPAVVDNHLNSKNNSIYTAAMGTIRALISNLDNALLLQPFCMKAEFLSGKAKVELVDIVAELVRELYPRKPQLVEQKALHLLWHLLGSSCKSTALKDATTSLCYALHTQMGPMLLKKAGSQSPSIIKSLKKILHESTRTTTN